MKFLVAVDLEGIACAYGASGGSVEEAFNIQFIRKQASREANSAVKALFDNGADEVVVWDCHGRGCSLDYEQIDERALLAIGSTVGHRFPVIEGLDGVVLIGYHAMSGTEDAILCHTLSLKKYQWVKINGVACGEIALDAMIAGKHQVPVIFVASDDKGVKEAKGFLPWVETCETKKSLAQTRILSKHPAAVVKEIYQGVSKAVSRLEEMKPYCVEGPVELEVRFLRPDECQHACLFDIHGKPFGLKDAYTRSGIVHSCEDMIMLI